MDGFGFRGLYILLSGLQQVIKISKFRNDGLLSSMHLLAYAGGWDNWRTSGCLESSLSIFYCSGWGLSVLELCLSKFSESRLVVRVVSSSARSSWWPALLDVGLTLKSEHSYAHRGKHLILWVGCWPSGYCSLVACYSCHEGEFVQVAIWQSIGCQLRRQSWGN